MVDQTQHLFFYNNHDYQSMFRCLLQNSFPLFILVEYWLETLHSIVWLTVPFDPYDIYSIWPGYQRVSTLSQCIHKISPKQDISRYFMMGQLLEMWSNQYHWFLKLHVNNFVSWIFDIYMCVCMYFFHLFQTNKNPLINVACQYLLPASLCSQRNFCSPFGK